MDRRRRRMWEELREELVEGDFDYDYEYRRRMAAYEYDRAYRRRLRELEYWDRMHEWEMAEERRIPPYEREEGVMERRIPPHEREGVMDRHIPPYEREGVMDRHIPPYERGGVMDRHIPPYERGVIDRRIPHEREEGGTERHIPPFERQEDDEERFLPPHGKEENIEERGIPPYGGGENVEERGIHPYEYGEDVGLPEDLNDYEYGEWEGEYNEYDEWAGEYGTWYSEEGWMNVGGEEMNTYENIGQKIQECDAGEMDMEEDDEDEATKEQKRVFKLKRYTAIPLSYLGPMFLSNFNEFRVEVSPISHMDVWNTSFTSITSNATSLRLVLRSGKTGQNVNSSLILMAKDTKVRNLLRGVITQNFKAESFSIKVEQREAVSEKEEDELQTFPKVIHKASFTIKNRSLRTHTNLVTTTSESSEEKQSALNLLNLPRNVDWTFLRILFPFSLSCQVIEGETRSALLQMKSAKMALLYLASVTGLRINDQPIQMKTDVPQQEAVQLLRETEDDVSQDQPVKKRKKLSPSDIRRNLKKKQEYAERLAKIARLPPVPLFPGTTNLLGMSFSGPGNMPGPSATAVSRGAAHRGASGTVPTKRALGASQAAGKDSSEDFPVVPIPQILEGPYPAASNYYAPGTPSAPGTSQKIRTQGYFRRRGARVAVHQAHIWGGNLELAGKALARSLIPEDKRPTNIMAPPQMLSVKPLTDVQLKKLRKFVREKVTLDELRKAEEHWQRKRKEREAAGLSVVRTKDLDGMDRDEISEAPNVEKSALKGERDRQRITEYMNMKTQIQPAAPQKTADSSANSGSGDFTSATRNRDFGFQRGDGTPSQARSWNKEQAPAGPSDTTDPKPWFYQAPPPLDKHQPHNQEQYYNEHAKSVQHVPQPVPPPQNQNQYPSNRDPWVPQPVPPPQNQNQNPSSRDPWVPQLIPPPQNQNQNPSSRDPWVPQPVPPPQNQNQNPSSRDPWVPQLIPPLQNKYQYPNSRDQSFQQLPQPVPPPPNKYQYHNNRDPSVSQRVPPPQNQNQYPNKRDQSFQDIPKPVPPPCPPSPPARPAQSPHNRFSPSRFQKPAQPPQNRFAHPPPPKPSPTSQTPPPRPDWPNHGSYSHSPRPRASSQSSQPPISRPPPPVPPPPHEFSQPPPYRAPVSAPHTAASEFPAQQSQFRQPAPPQPRTAHRSFRPGQQQQQQESRRKPRSASAGPRSQDYSHYTNFWRRGGVLNPATEGQGNPKHKQSGEHRRH